MQPESGEWVRVENAACRCSRCGALVQDTWRYFRRGSLTYTLAWCDGCTGEQAGKPGI